LLSSLCPSSYTLAWIFIVWIVVRVPCKKSPANRMLVMKLTNEIITTSLWLSRSLASMNIPNQVRSMFYWAQEEGPKLEDITLYTEQWIWMQKVWGDQSISECNLGLFEGVQCNIRVWNQEILHLNREKKQALHKKNCISP